MYTNYSFGNKRFFHIIIRSLSSGGYFLLLIAMIISYSGCKGGSSSDGDPVLAGDGKNIPITPMESEPQTPAEQPQSDPSLPPILRRIHRQRLIPRRPIPQQQYRHPIPIRTAAKRGRRPTTHLLPAPNPISLQL
ncbi:MAG: hypothetical protein IPL33_16995 [Sphingobacteriales bacterium]|nr:hypothetical protein [Sphingobacteriales bacterium]